VDLLYRDLFESVEDPEQISAVYDQDRAHYHIFFPQPGGVMAKRLTLAMNPEGGEPQLKFSTGSFLNARCGAFLAGTLVVGTSGGVYGVLRDGKTHADGVTPQFDIITPMLWHGSLTETKETHSLLIQVAGKGIILIDAVNDAGRVLGSLEIEATDDPDDNYFVGVPLSRQYERPWQHRYRGAQYRIRSKGGDGLLRLIGFAVNVKT
jgi:archaellum component FlaG (FlaF/FlaG flagellin family)